MIRVCQTIPQLSLFKRYDQLWNLTPTTVRLQRARCSLKKIQCRLLDSLDSLPDPSGIGDMDACLESSNERQFPYRFALICTNHT